jgi:arsenate reductase
MTMTLYGISNCDTVKKARRWLDAHELPYAFHDYKKAGVDEVRLADWVERLGWEKLLNRAGTTFRNLADADKVDLDRSRAVAVMLAHPSSIKRPVLVRGDLLLVGFTPDAWEAALT